MHSHKIYYNNDCCHAWHECLYRSYAVKYSRPYKDVHCYMMCTTTCRWLFQFKCAMPAFCLVAGLCLQPVNTLQVVVAGSDTVTFLLGLFPSDGFTWRTPVSGTSGSAAGYQTASEPSLFYNIPCAATDFTNCPSTSNADHPGLWVIRKSLLITFVRCSVDQKTQWFVAVILLPHTQSHSFLNDGKFNQ